LNRDTWGRYFSFPAGAGCNGPDTQIVQELPATQLAACGTLRRIGNGMFTFGGAGDNLKGVSYSGVFQGCFLLSPTFAEQHRSVWLSGHHAIRFFQQFDKRDRLGDEYEWLRITRQLRWDRACSLACVRCNESGNRNSGTVRRVPGTAAGIAVKFTVPTVANGKSVHRARGATIPGVARELCLANWTYTACFLILANSRRFARVCRSVCI